MVHWNIERVESLNADEVVGGVGGRWTPTLSSGWGWIGSGDRALENTMSSRRI